MNKPGQGWQRLCCERSSRRSLRPLPLRRRSIVWSAELDRALLQDYEHSLGAALRTLGDAGSSRRTTEQRLRGLDQARHDLHRAYAAAPDLVARSEVQELVAAAWLLAQSSQDALDALQEAATLLRDALYATAISGADIRAEVERRKPVPTSSLARARRWWSDKATADAAANAGALGVFIRDAPVHELAQTRVRENGAAAEAIADRLRRVQTARRGLREPNADAPMPIIRRESVVFRDRDGADLVYCFIAGWEPAASDAESERYSLFVAARERFELVRDEDARRWAAMTPEQREAERAAVRRMPDTEGSASSFRQLFDECVALETGHASRWPPAAPGHWSWPRERSSPPPR